MKKLLLTLITIFQFAMTDSIGQSKFDSMIIDYPWIAEEFGSVVPKIHEVKEIELPNKVKLEYAEQGDPSGTVVILLHGITDSWRSYELVLPHLPETLHVFSISLRGHGNSSRPESGYTPEDFAADISAFMKARQIKSAVIVGHSMSSVIAQSFALNYPHQTKGLVLVGSFTAFGENPGGIELNSVVQNMKKIDPQFALEFQKGTIVKNTDAEFLSMVTNETMKVPVHVFQQALEGLMISDYRNLLPVIQKPVLLIWGSLDNFVPYTEQEVLLKMLNDSRLIKYEGAGHGVHWDMPEKFAADLSTFINNNIK